MKENMNHVTELHQSSIIIDAHSDAIGDSLGLWVKEERPLGKRSTWGQFDIPRATEGGLTAILLAISYYPQLGGSPARQALRFIDAFYEEIEQNSDRVMLAVTADDILRAKQENKIAFVLTMEGAEGLEGDIRVLRVFHRLGLRFLGFTWNRRNEAANGMDERESDGGLTRFGKDLVKECNRLGITIDLAHLAPNGVRDVLAMTEKPVVSTHTGTYTVWHNPRSLRDDVLEAIAKTGGAIGLTPLPPLLGPTPNHSILPKFLDQFEHAVKIMGEDGVGFGSDYDGAASMTTEGIQDVSMLPNLTMGLVERGFQEKTIRKILGENFLRVLRTAQE